MNEQLFPMKVRCRFTQYMTNKPDKFGIKFWLAVDVQSKYILNAISYLRKDEARPATQRLSESVVIKLVEPYLGKASQQTIFLLRLILPQSSGKKRRHLSGP